jgi:hypothetical protein
MIVPKATVCAVWAWRALRTLPLVGGVQASSAVAATPIKAAFRSFPRVMAVSFLKRDLPRDDRQL